MYSEDYLVVHAPMWGSRFINTLKPGLHYTFFSLMLTQIWPFPRNFYIFYACDVVSNEKNKGVYDCEDKGDANIEDCN